MRALHWFRSDLRLEDNTALTAACNNGEVIPLYILDPKLIDVADDSRPRGAFLLAGLRALRLSIESHGARLLVLCGEPVELLPDLCRRLGVTRVYWNRDYSPYAKRRDQAVETALKRIGVESTSCKDRVAFEAKEIRTVNGGGFKVYTPYKRRLRLELEELISTPALNPALEPLDITFPADSVNLDGLGQRPTVPLPEAGEQAARQRLETFLDSTVSRYAEDRDYPDRDGTSRLSPYLRFGMISVRTCFKWAVDARRENPARSKGVETWVDELIWREFYHGILDEHPHVARGAFRPEFAHVEWDNDEHLFEAWCEGQTGFPFVDAAMRQLNETGWMHNRARMVVASFLTKDLLIDWRRGERYFMQHLLDGDPASNNGGWQWAASTGTDAQPYFRIFNPQRQGEKFDPDARYIQRWVPELRDLGAKAIHSLGEERDLFSSYRPPIVDHKTQRLKAIERYQRSRALHSS